MNIIRHILNREILGTPDDGTGPYTKVASYSDLPDPGDNPAKVYIVLESSGVWFVNRYEKGLYYSNGTEWTRLGNYPDYTTEGYLKTETDPLSLHLDQTVPQTIVNGIPLLDQVNGAFNDPRQIVNKQYIDKRVRGGGGFIAPVFFLTSDSDIPTYKRIDYVPETLETEIPRTINAGDGEVLCATYIYDDPIGTDLLDPGVYTANYRVKVSSAQGETQLIFEAFVRNLAGVETTLFKSYGSDIDNLEFETLRNESNEPSFIVNSTDRFGVRICAVTTRVADITITTVVGGEHGSYFSTPIALRHSLLRGRDASDQHPISAITDLTTTLSNFVPYTGATADVNLGSKIVLTPEIKTDGVAPADLKITTGAEKTVELGSIAWDDMMVELGAVRQGSSSATWTPYRGSEILAFATNASNKIFFRIQFSHRIKTGTDTEFHVHTVAPDNNAGGVVWSLSVSYANIGDDFGPEGTPTQVTQTIAINSQDKHDIFSIKNPFTANAGISSIALCSLTRLGNDEADDYANDIYLVALDAHYQIDTMGSRQRTLK